MEFGHDQMFWAPDSAEGQQRPRYGANHESMYMMPNQSGFLDTLAFQPHAHTHAWSQDYHFHNQQQHYAQFVEANSHGKPSTLTLMLAEGLASMLKTQEGYFLF